MALEIPKDEVGGVIELVKLDERPIDQLFEALSAAPKLSDSDEMAEIVARSVPAVSKSQVSKILSTLYGLYYIRELSDVEPDEFLDDVMESVAENPYIEPALREPQLGLLKNRLGKLLKIETLLVIAKAARLQRDGERLYCESKILSDVRPVFGEDPTTRPPGAVITHTLKIAYHEMGKHGNFHVVLDSVDLKALKEVIDRAITKDETLRSFLKEANLIDLGL